MLGNYPKGKEKSSHRPPEGSQQELTTCNVLRPKETSPGEASVQSGQISESKGLVSIDRSKAAALLSTTPRLKPRSSTNDLAPLHCMGWVSLRHMVARLSRPRRAVLLWLNHRGRRNRTGPAYRCLPTPRRKRYRYTFGRDSDLEAFSHNPSDGSFAPLAYQPST